MTSEEGKPRRSRRLKRALLEEKKNPEKERPAKIFFATENVKQIRKRCICFDCKTLSDNGVFICPEYTPIEKKAHDIISKYLDDFLDQQFGEFDVLLTWKSHDMKMQISVFQKGGHVTRKYQGWTFKVDFFHKGFNFCRGMHEDEDGQLHPNTLKLRANHAIHAFVSLKNPCKDCLENDCDKDTTVTVEVIKI